MEEFDEIERLIVAMPDRLGFSPASIRRLVAEATATITITEDHSAALDRFDTAFSTYCLAMALNKGVPTEQAEYFRDEALRAMLDLKLMCRPWLH